MSDKRSTCSVCGQTLNILERLTAYYVDGRCVCHGCVEDICGGWGVAPFGDFNMRRFFLKLFFGIVCLAAVVNTDSVGAALVLACTGLGLLAWSVVPVFLERNRVESCIMKSFKRDAEMRAVRRKCSNCGGISDGAVCAYCGLPFDDDASIVR